MPIFVGAAIGGFWGSCSDPLYHSLGRCHLERSSPEGRTLPGLTHF